MDLSPATIGSVKDDYVHTRVASERPKHEAGSGLILEEVAQRSVMLTQQASIVSVLQLPHGSQMVLGGGPCRSARCMKSEFLVTMAQPCFAAKCPHSVIVCPGHSEVTYMMLSGNRSARLFTKRGERF